MGWENGEVTTEPLSIIAADDPVSCTMYAKENDLLELPGWKQFRNIAKHQPKFFRLANQAKLRSYHHAPKYKYGHEIPRDYNHAMMLDKQNGNTKWLDATKLELALMDDSQVFKDYGTTYLCLRVTKELRYT